MSLQTIVLIDGEAIVEETTRAFALGSGQVPATLSSSGVADTGEDIAIEKLVSGDDLNAAAPGDWQAIIENGAGKVLSGTNNAVAIYSPGRYRIKTANVTYASGAVTVVLDQ